MDSRELAFRIRREAIEMTHASHASHIGAVLSVADIIAVLYADILNVDPGEPMDGSRDRFILSKGHAGISVYVALAETGFFPKEWLQSYYGNGSLLSGHISHRQVPGVEVSTGSLGHGIAMAVGMALAAKLDRKGHHIYAVVGDGECQEGAVWETAAFAAFHRLDNLTVVVDNNEMQAMGTCGEQLGWTDLAVKWKAFGFETLECNGHDHEDIKRKLGCRTEGRPVCIIAHTVKGKGVSFMENNLLWHYRDPQNEWYERACLELERDWEGK